MSILLKKRVKKLGLPPGSLVNLNGDPLNKKVKISLIDYDVGRCIEKDDIAFDECLAFMNRPSTTWINICGIQNPTLLTAVGERFGLHPLLLEDVMTLGQRSKLDDYKEYLFIVLRMLKIQNPLKKIEDEQVSLVLGKNFVLSFLENSDDLFNLIRERIRSPHSRMRKAGADYLCYSLIDCIVDHYFVILEALDDKLEHLEEHLIKAPTEETMQDIHRIKKEVIHLRKTVWPIREVVNNFRRIETPLIKDSTKVFMHDVYDHTIQAIDTIESFRDISSGMLDVYLSSMSQRMNEIMKVLTVVSTLFVPLTFIASVYGMNFENLPEIHWKWGYPATLSIMACVALGMLRYFRRKKWI